jgi:hypothetical protein
MVQNKKTTRQMKQTAVEWLVEQLDGERHLTENEIKRVIEQAKEMEKDQIVKAYENLDFNLVDGEDYYNKTYIQKEQ